MGLSPAGNTALVGGEADWLGYPGGQKAARLLIGGQLRCCDSTNFDDGPKLSVTIFTTAGLPSFLCFPLPRKRPENHHLLLITPHPLNLPFSLSSTSHLSLRLSRLEFPIFSFNLCIIYLYLIPNHNVAIAYHPRGMYFLPNKQTFA